MEKKKERRERGGRERWLQSTCSAMTAGHQKPLIRLTSWSERGRKRHLHRGGAAALQPALWKLQKCHLVPFTQKAPGNSADISNLVMGIFTLLPLFVSHPQGDEWEQVRYTCQILWRFVRSFFIFIFIFFQIPDRLVQAETHSRPIGDLR